MEGRLAATTSELMTGWEPDAPIGDTMLRRFVFALAGAWEPVVAAMGGRVQRCAEFAVADSARPAGYGNAVTLLQPLPPGDPVRSDAVLDGIEATRLGVACQAPAYRVPEVGLDRVQRRPGVGPRSTSPRPRRRVVVRRPGRRRWPIREQVSRQAVILLATPQHGRGHGRGA